MPKKTGKKEQVLLKLDDEIKPKFDALRSYYGARANADLVRVLINDKYNQIKTSLKVSLPRFEILNVDENGTKIIDRQIHVVAQVYLKPEGIRCGLCGKEKCEHTDFALAQPDIQDIIRKRRRNGWKLPEVN